MVIADGILAVAEMAVMTVKIAKLTAGRVTAIIGITIDTVMVLSQTKKTQATIRQLDMVDLARKARTMTTSQKMTTSL